MQDAAAHRPVAAHAAPTAVGRLLMVAALAGLLNAAWRRCRAIHDRRLEDRPATKPDKLQVWEDEGGQNQMSEAPR